MRKSFILFFLISSFLFLTGCSNNKKELSYESAARAFQKLDLQKSELILKGMLKSKSLNKKLRYKILKTLAWRDWKFHHNYPSAIVRLMEADSLGLNRSSVWIDISIIERKARNYLKSLEASEKAKGFATNEQEKREADLEFASTIYKMSLVNIEKNEPLNIDNMKKAETVLLKILEADSGAPAPSRLLMGLSLLLNNGENFQKAWQSYFHISSMDYPYPYFKNASEKLKKAITYLKGASPSADEQNELIKALGASRLYRMAYRYSQAHCDKSRYDSETADILEFAQYLIDAKKTTDEYYRQISLKNENVDKYKKWLENRRKKMWNSLSAVKGKEYSELNYMMEMRKLFGAFEFTGGTGNYSGYVLGLGLIVNQEVKKIEQYKYEADFTYTQVDMMESIGYSTWFWGRGIGGTATANEIIRVRSAYLDGPFEAWTSITNPEEIEENRRDIEKFLALPADTDIYATAAGLSKKLWNDGINSIYVKLKSHGLTGSALKLAFLQEYARCRVEASIFAHEGRHAIDQKYFAKDFKSWSNTEREFRAKLSQITFATAPRMELAQMIGTISKNSKSGHDQANIKIAETAIEWIKKNRDKIVSYSDKKSPFSQVYLLTPEQLRQCYREADELYKQNMK